MSEWTIDPFHYYPVAGGLDEKPWWRFEDSRFTRADGLHIERRHDLPGWDVWFSGDEPQLLRAMDVGTVENLAALTYVDASVPMGRPSIRVGQVWFSRNGIAQLVVINSHSADVELDVSEDVLVAGPGAPWVPPGWERPPAVVADE